MVHTPAVIKVTEAITAKERPSGLYFHDTKRGYKRISKLHNENTFPKFSLSSKRPLKQIEISRPPHFIGCSMGNQLRGIDIAEMAYSKPGFEHTWSEEPRVVVSLPSYGGAS